MPWALGRSPANAAAWRRSWCTAILLAATGCGGSKYEQIKAPDYADGSVRSLAIAPSDSLFGDGSQLADAVGAELGKRGFTVVDTTGAAVLLSKYGISQVDVRAPEALAALGKEGVDAILSVSSTAATMGGPGMRHVKVRLISTRTSKEIGGIDWHNAWGGVPGSPADFTMRKGLADAAQEIAEALAKLLG